MFKEGFSFLPGRGQYLFGCLTFRVGGLIDEATAMADVGEPIKVLGNRNHVRMVSWDLP
jgi:hypothetical protein